MNSLPFRICEQRDYDAQVLFVDSVVDRRCQLPENPFRNLSLVYRFDEFDWTMSGDFWNTIRTLSSQSLDDEVLMAVLAPDPADYFKLHFEDYKWARLPVSMSVRQYWEFINDSPAGSPADSILAVSKRITWIPQSKKWCIWAERESGLCVAGSNLGFQDVPFKCIDWALNWCRPWANATYLQRLQANFEDSQVI